VRVAWLPDHTVNARTWLQNYRRGINPRRSIVQLVEPQSFTDFAIGIACRYRA